MNFRKVQKKIKTIANVKKITKAMQMVSAVKMRKSQTAALEGRLYTQKLEAAVRRIITARDILIGIGPWFAKQSQNKRSLYILISSDKGLCGNFNANLLKFSYSQINFEHDCVIVVGKRAADFIRRVGGSIQSDFSQSSDKSDINMAIFSDVSSSYIAGDFSHVYIIYNRFISSFKSFPTKENFLPLSDLSLIAHEEEIQESASEAKTQYKLEPSDGQLLESLIQDLLVQKIRRAIMDSQAAEHSARMLAMKNATDNAQELIYSLTLVRNKLRQGSITNELLEMTSAKESSEYNVS